MTTDSNSSDSNGASDSPSHPYDVGDRAQKWALVYEDRFGGYLGQLQGSRDGESVRLRNVIAYDLRLVVPASIVPTGPNQLGVVKGQAEEQRNVWDLDACGPDTIVTVANPRAVVTLADASVEDRTRFNQAITIIEAARKQKMGAKLGLDLSGKMPLPARAG